MGIFKLDAIGLTQVREIGVQLSGVLALFQRKVKQYPVLTAYLRHQEARDNDEPGRMARAALTFLFVISIIPGIALAANSFPWLLFPAIGLGVGLALDYRRRRMAGETTTEMLRKRSRAVGKTMLQCLDKRRLHRDLDEGSLILLEESGAYWIKIHNAFTSPEWMAKDLPEPYVRIRKQTLAAAELAMDEMILLFRPYLPVEVKRRPVGDFVEEVVEDLVFNGMRVPDLPSPAFTPARQVAEKLRDLASEVESIKLQELLFEPMRPAAEAALDRCMLELQAISQAERELRQDLNA